MIPPAGMPIALYRTRPDNLSQQRSELVPSPQNVVTIQVAENV
jgi:hypothetical protein